MTTDTPTPGPRQTVDRVCHPTLGEGIAVYHNGPAYFQADSGEVVMMRSIDIGGCGTFGGTEFRSYNVAHGLDGSRVELDTTKRAKGDSHYRRWHAMHGAGWLVQLHGIEDCWRHRFEPDDGKPFTFDVTQMSVGRTGALDAADKKRGKSKGKMSDEDEQWFSLVCKSGEIVAFRREPPPVETAAPVVADREVIH